MTVDKRCFMDKDRPCDLTCKAAFEVDDPVDNVDCYFIWLAHHFGEGLYSLRSVLENMPFGGGPPEGGPGASPGGPGMPGVKGPKGPKGFPTN